MAILFIEGFEHYGPTDGAMVGFDAFRKWGYGNGSAYHMVGGGRYGGKALAFYHADGYYGSLTKDIGFQYATVAVGFGIKPYFGGGVIGTGPLANDRVLELTDANGVLHLCLRVINLDLSEWRIENGLGTTLFTYTGPAPPNWSYIEIKVHIHDTAGTLDVKFNGTTIFSVTGEHTVGPGANQGVQKVRIQNGTDYGTIDSKPCRNCAFDDFYIAEDFVNNAASSTINMLRPSGDAPPVGASWIPNSGFTRYNRLVDQPCDNDATYIYSEGSGTRTLCTYEDIPVGGANVVSGPIHCMALNAILRDTGGGAIISQVYGEDSNQFSMYQGSGINVPGGAYSGHQAIFPTHALSGNPWTVARINSTTAGVFHSG